MPSYEQELVVVQNTIESVRSAVQIDGGDLKLVSFENDIARVLMQGNCIGCLMAGQTLGGIRRQLTETLGRPVRVFPAWEDDDEEL